VRIVVFDDFRIGTAEADGIHDLTDLIEDVPAFAAITRMNEFIARFDELRDRVEARRRSRAGVIPLDAVRLRSPVPCPRNFLAAPLNYAAHGDEVRDGHGNSTGTARELGFFVKASGSICGQPDAIELPVLPGRRFDHEGEIGVVIGRETRAASRDVALKAVFGYTMLVDVTMRMTETQREERPMRKSFSTFAPTGPWIVTADEIDDPSTLTVRLFVNDEQRQSGTLTDLIVDVPGLIVHASSVLTLMPGDLYATGSPAGVGPIVPGDALTVQCDAIGELRLNVTQRGW
jgi:2-keto-4-pentenoate hydratase/2-oxohepta-3-ene-1,7-dioic acid hydratase in catechol pathway